MSSGGDPLPHGWIEKVSRTHGRPYYVNEVTGETLWERPGPSAPAAAVGIAAGASVPAACGDDTSPLDLEATLPSGCAPVSVDTLCVKTYDPVFRADGCWSIRQLGAARASEELHHWQMLAPATAATSTATTSDATLRDVARALLLSAAALSDGGLPELLASAWDAQKRQYALDRSAFSGAAVGGEKRSRSEFEGAGASSTASSAALVLAPAVAGEAVPVVRPWDFYPRLRGAELYTSSLLKPNEVIRRIYQEGKVVTPSGKVNKISAAVGPYEGIHLYQLVLDNKFTRTLEVGMANGLSTLFICQAMRDSVAPGALHTSIDPFQSTQWENVARTNIAAAGLESHSQVMETFSYQAMPELLAKGQRFDMVLIDGMHLFDFTLVDFFYADLLTRVGGVIVLDDIRHRGVAPVLDYVKGNYKYLRFVASTGCRDTMATFVKVGEDARSWNFHVGFNGGSTGGLGSGR